MKFLKDRGIDFGNATGIFRLINEANEKKANGEKVYNGIIGALHNEDGKLTVHESVFKVFNSVDIRKKSTYASDIDGGVDFANCVKEWVFQNNDFLKVSTVVATPGGSGLISMVFDEMLSHGDTVLIPNILWTSYDLMAKMRGLKILSYSMFDGEKFNLEGIKENLSDVVNTQKNTVIIVNDPAHNPTGYSMSIEEWKELVSFCNEITSEYHTITILNDIAYIDYSRDFEKSREYMKVFKNLSDNVSVVFSFSASKTFTFYGMRVGAGLVYNNSKEVRESIHDAFERHARATWSNCNSGAMETVVEVLKNNREDFVKELSLATDTLSERTRIFVEEAKKVGLDHYPVKEGFFITLKGVEGKNDLIFEKLKENNIYFTTQKKGLRVAICSLNIEECRELPKLIQEIVKGF